MRVRLWIVAMTLMTVSLAGAQESLPRPTLTLDVADQAAPALRPMTLDEVINTTLLADPKLRSAFEEITQATGDVWTASLRPNPTASVGGQLLPLTRPFTVDRTGGPPEFDVGFNWQIDWFLFGKRTAAMIAASRQLNVTEQEYYDTVRQRIRDAAVGFYDLLEAKMLLEQARQDLENLKKVEAVTKKAVETGGRAAVELNRISLDALRSAQALREAESTLNAARSKLRAFLGRNDADPNFDVSGALDLPDKTPTITSDEAFAQAVANRPDIASLRYKIGKAEADTRVEKRKAFPEVTAKVGYQRQFQRLAVGQPDANAYNVGVDFSLPIFDRNQGNRLKAASNLVQSQFDYQAGLVELRSEIDQVLQELRTAQANAEAAAGPQLKLAEQVRDAITKAYQAGGRPLLDVLDAQRNYRETYRFFISSRANYWRASVKLNATLGKKVVP
jgi:cobalt-zinc-cadmium efflux system outer membrane protein